jgi:hypothetical protein
MSGLLAALRASSTPSRTRVSRAAVLVISSALVAAAAFAMFELAPSRATRDDNHPAPSAWPAVSHGRIFTLDSTQPNPPAFDPRLSPNHGARICVSVCIESVHNAQELYLSWVRDPDGPTGRERTIRGVQEVSSQCESCKTYLGINPLTPSLENAAGPLFSAIDELLPVALEAEKYYDRGLYKSDALAAGRKLHKPLLTAYSNVAKTGHALRVAAQQIELTEQAVQHAPLYLPARALLKAGGRDFSTIDVAELERAVVGFESALAAAPPGDNDVHARAKSLAIAARELLQKRNASNPFSTRERAEIGTGLGRTVRGSPEQLIAAYEHLGSSLEWLAPCRHYLSQPIE